MPAGSLLLWRLYHVLITAGQLMFLACRQQKGEASWCQQQKGHNQVGPRFASPKGLQQALPAPIAVTKYYVFDPVTQQTMRCISQTQLACLQTSNFRQRATTQLLLTVAVISVLLSVQGNGRRSGVVGGINLGNDLIASLAAWISTKCLQNRLMQ